MGRFLIIVSTRLDDYPVRILDDVNLRAARKEAEKLDADAVVENLADRFGRDDAEAITVSVVRFRTNGQPAEQILVRDLLEEREEAAQEAELIRLEEQEARERASSRSLSGCS